MFVTFQGEFSGFIEEWNTPTIWNDVTIFSHLSLNTFPYENCGFSLKQKQKKSQTPKSPQKTSKTKTSEIGFSVSYLLWLIQDYNSGNLFLIM